MQTFNQALHALYQRKLITLETALVRSSNNDELQDMMNRALGEPWKDPPQAVCTGSALGASFACHGGNGPRPAWWR